MAHPTVVRYLICIAAICLGWDGARADETLREANLSCDSQPVPVATKLISANAPPGVRWNFGHKFSLTIEKTEPDRLNALEVWTGETRLFTIGERELQSFRLEQSRVEIPFIVTLEGQPQMLPQLEGGRYVLPLKQGSDTSINLIAKTSRGHQPGCGALEFTARMREIQAYALVAGFNYTGKPHALKFAVADAEAVTQHLIKNLKVMPRNIWLMTDDVDGSSARLPKETNITAATGPDQVQNTMNLIYQKADYQSLLYVYYSGHIFVDQSGDRIVPRLVFPDSAEGKPSTYLSREEFMRITQDIQVSSLILIMDACFSGSSQARYADGSSGILPGSKAYRLPTGAYAPMDPMLRGGARIMSSQADQTSWEFEELGHGVFTYYLLKSAAAGKEVTLVEAYLDAKKNMLSFTPKGWSQKLKQDPVEVFANGGVSMLWNAADSR